jgi:hypothetical protein
MPFCVECGFKLGERDRFCSSCGHKAAEPVNSIPTKPNSAVREQKVAAPVLAQVNTRIVPIYGQSYDPKIHCFNCGSKKGNVKKCSVCNEIEGDN